MEGTTKAKLAKGWEEFTTSPKPESEILLMGANETSLTLLETEVGMMSMLVREDLGIVP